MGITTKIDWCDSTLNLMMGCDGCELSGGHCYAESHVGRYAGRKGYPAAFRKPELFFERLEPALRWPDLTGTRRPDKPWLDGLPRLVFLNDLGDTFTESLPVDWLWDAVDRMAQSPCCWLILTKRPMRFAAFVDAWRAGNDQIPFPWNIWGGTTVTADDRLGRAAILANVPLAVRFLSLEPLLGRVDLEPVLWPACPACLRRAGVVRVDEAFYCRRPGCRCAMPIKSPFDWVIVGGESGRGARPMHPEWARKCRDDCKEAGVPFFFKQWGEWVPFCDPNEWRDMPEKTPVCLLKADGSVIRPYSELDAPGKQMVRVGKSAAGRSLDREEHSGMPRIS